jgi:hypothetical protein
VERRRDGRLGIFGAVTRAAEAWWNVIIVFNKFEATYCVKRQRGDLNCSLLDNFRKMRGSRSANHVVLIWKQIVSANESFPFPHASVLLVSLCVLVGPSTERDRDFIKGQWPSVSW